MLKHFIILVASGYFKDNVPRIFSDYQIVKIFKNSRG